MNDHAKMIKRLDEALEQNFEAQAKVWAEFSRTDQYGRPTLTASGKKKMEKLVRERRELEASASAAYRI